LQAAAWISTMAEIMIRERPNIVQIATAAEASIGIWLRQWLRLPYVAYAHGNEVLAAMQTNGQKSRLGLIQANRVIAVSRFTANLAQKAGVSPERIEVVHPGCDADRFRPLKPRVDLRQKFLGDRYRNRVLLTVGNVMARKGHDMVIRALPRLRQNIPDITYLIVGPCSRPSPLESLAVELGVRDCIIFASDVSSDDLPYVYALADVFVMPSRQELEACDVEGFGLVFLEASACAKPVVGGRSGGIPDAIAEGTSGLLVDSNDHEELANTLERLLTDRDLAIRMGQQGRSWVVKHFGWGRVAERVQEILHSVLEETRVRGLRPFTESPREGNLLR
jgi:phosphatidylinositol alpha-1,6-mannosyltransferase